MSYAHQFEDGRSHVGEFAVLHALDLVSGIDYYELNGVEGMGRVRSAVRIDSIVRISVVCGKEHCIALTDCGFHNLLHTLVNLGNRAADGSIDSRVAHHISVCKIQDNHILLAGLDGSHKFLCHFSCAHFRQKVVGRDLR